MSADTSAAKTEISTKAQTVLLAGATGMLGNRIAVHLLEQPGLRQPGSELRLLLRPGTLRDAAKVALLEPLMARGAVTVEAKLTDPDALRTATARVDVVLSALQGGPDVVVDGQIALAEAAADTGVRRILPSDYALDLFKATPGEHASFDLRRDADDAIAALGMEHVHVLGGAFMDAFLGPYGGLFDHSARTATYFGTGDEAFDATSVDDTARYAARVALDRTVESGKFAVAAEQLSFRRATDTVERITGSRYTPVILGSVEDLRAGIDAARAGGASAEGVLMQVYLLYMLTGQTALEDLQNDRYPDIRPQTLDDVLRRTLGELPVGATV